MAFTSKNLQYKKSGLTFIKGATLFFLGMSAVLFLTQAFDIVPSVTNRAQLIKEVLFTADGSQSGNTGAYIDGSGGNAYFAGAISGNVVAANVVCLNGDTSILGSCRTEWPTGGTAGGESLWFTGTNSIYYTGGNVGIGTGTPSAKLEVNGNVKIGDYLTLLSIGYGEIHSNSWLGFFTSGTSNPKMIINNSGYVGIGTSNPTTTLQVSGDVTARAYYYNSDINMKTDLSPITDPLNKILLLNGYMFTWKATDKRDMGVIAQEVEKVFPEIIHTDDQGYKSVEYGNLIAPLIEAIKELNQKLDEQAQKIQELEMK